MTKIAAYAALLLTLLAGVVLPAEPLKRDETVLVVPFDSHGTVLDTDGDRVLVRVERWMHRTDLWVEPLTPEAQEHEDFCCGH